MHGGARGSCYETEPWAGSRAPAEQGRHKHKGCDERGRTVTIFDYKLRKGSIKRACIFEATLIGVKVGVGESTHRTGPPARQKQVPASPRPSVRGALLGTAYSRGMRIGEIK